MNKILKKKKKNLVLFLFSFVSKIGAGMLWDWVCLLQEVALPLEKEDKPGSGPGGQRLEADCLRAGCLLSIKDRA